MKRKKFCRIFTAVCIWGMCFSFGMSVFAVWQTEGETDNILSLGSYKVRINEQYTAPAYVNPGERVTKIVNVENQGTVDSLVRVSIQSMFGTERSDGTFQEDSSLDPRMILLDLNDGYWMKRGDYYYYKEILKAGKTTREPLMNGYQLSAAAGNIYEKRDARIVVTMESIQANGKAAEEIWGISSRELGVSGTETVAEKDTSVTYKGKDGGFDISKSKTDLFANFKDLTPGCARSQTIRLSNSSEETVEICLRAEAAEQEVSSEELKMVEKLLQQYAHITVLCDGQKLYQGPVSGIAVGESMEKGISLGSFSPDERKNLVVKLSLDPETDNSFMGLTGKVRWIFSVKGEEEDTSNAIYPAKTGISSNIFGYLLLFCLFAAGGTTSAVMNQKSKMSDRG